MKVRIFIFFSILILSTGAINVFAQADTVIGQVSASGANSFAGGVSGDGRLVVFESSGNLATENPRNADGNQEIFVFDYAQRRIFQITDTKSVLNNTGLAPSPSNTKVLINNTRPVLSNDGKWIAFSSNATTSASGSPANGTNPGSFDGNGFTNSVQGADPLNLENVTAGTTMANVVQPTGPSVVRLQFTDLNVSITAFNVTVAGTDASNAAISETFTFSGGLIQVGTQMFTTVTSVTLNSIAGSSASDTLSFSYGDGSNPLTADGNIEMWMFGFQNSLTPVDISQGEEIAATDLSAGTFIQITNTPTTRLPLAGTNSTAPIVASDNTDPSISDGGNMIAFVSNRNLVANGNAPPQDNPEIFTYNRGVNTISQVTQTNRGQIFEPISNNVPTLSGNGLRVMFSSNANNPVIGMTGGVNTDLNEEIFYADLNATGAPNGTNKQVTTTTPTNPGEVVNVVNFGRRMSRDGKYLAFDSYADLTNDNSGENQVEFGTFLYDSDADTFRIIGERSNADSDATGGDIARNPGFTDYVGGTPQTLVMETRMNITPEGPVATNPDDGLNPIPSRPAQVYSFPLNETKGTEIFTRLSFFPPPPFTLATIQIYPSNSLKRTILTVPGSELGTGNADFSTEVYYLLKPDVNTESPASMSFATGATNQPVTNDPVPAQSPSPSPTPQTPPAVQGLSRGSIATVSFDAGINQPVTARTAVGSLDRRFSLPMELAGVSMSINGVTVGLKRVSRRQITFVIPQGLGSSFDVPFPVTINNNGVEIKGELILVSSRPDIFRFEENPEANRARILNVTNRVFTREPFTVRTLRYRGGVKVPTVLRVYLTGVQNLTGSLMSIRIGDEPVTNVGAAVLVEPGIFSVDFTLAPAHDMDGDQPVVITVMVGGNTFFGRLDNDAPRVRIL